ncbi:MAG: SCO family protein [Gammaproteobacteria bacterium]|nr:SCO family protein [Gammaproteobacteria bacterium]MDE0412612.1 SCO family protein [Gammaproteobacteria bacterium]
MRIGFGYLVLFGVLFSGTSCDRVPEQDTYLPGSHAARSQVKVIADGWKPDLPYKVPEPGTYDLPRIRVAGGGKVLGPDGNELELEDLMGDRIVLLTFIYSSCVDLNGCPLATAVFYKVKERFKRDRELSDKVRLISVSFDPEHDTPEVMRLYGKAFEQGDPQWMFLTTASEEVLEPIINQYGQMVIKEYDEDGKYKGTMAHVLRAFLIDMSKNIRQEYSVSFLHDQLVTADIKTLLIEQGVFTERTDS